MSSEASNERARWRTPPSADAWPNPRPMSPPSPGEALAFASPHLGLTSLMPIEFDLVPSMTTNVLLGIKKSTATDDHPLKERESSPPCPASRRELAL